MAEFFIETVEQYERHLVRAIEDLKRVTKDPTIGAAARAVLRELWDVQRWTADGMPLSSDEDAQLTFGQLASRAIGDIDLDLADRLLAIRDFLRHWRAPGH